MIFARTETADFHRQVWARAAALFFLRGRIHFYRKDGTRASFNSGAPSVLVAYGRRNADTLRDCSMAGVFVSLPERSEAP